MRSKRIGHLSARHVDASTFVALDLRREEEEKEEGQKGRREGLSYSGGQVGENQNRREEEKRGASDSQLSLSVS